VTTAIFGLIGVVVGAVVTGVVDLYMEHRRAQAAIFKSSQRLEALAEQKALVGDAYKSLTGEAIPLEPGAGRRSG
jgi:hypothetical protein